MRAFSLYLSQSHNARPKSSKQLLSTIASALRRLSDRAESLSDRTIVAETVISHLICSDDHTKAKASAMALGQFLIKDILSLDLVLDMFWRTRGCRESLNKLQELRELLIVLFRWLGRADFGSTIGHLVAVVLNKHESCSEEDHEAHAAPVWSGALKQAHRQAAVDVADLRVHILPVLFRRNVRDFVLFIRDVGFRALVGDDDLPDEGSGKHPLPEPELLYASLQTGKDLGLLCEEDERTVMHGDGPVLIPIRAIAGLLSCSSRAARLTGLSLLASSHSATRPISAPGLNLIHRHLSHFFADTDANFRSEVFSIVQRLMDRMRAITAVLAREASRSSVESDKVSSALRTHRTFIVRLLRLLQWELRPTASYQRHISALKCLSILTRSGLDDRISTKVLGKSALGEAKWPFSVPVVTNEVQSLLLDLLVDAFDDVRQTAATLLHYHDHKSTLGEEYLRAVQCAEKAMLATGRADHADGVAHMYALLHRQRASPSAETTLAEQPIVTHLTGQLNRVLRIAEANLAMAVGKYPIHGLLTSLRYVFTQTHAELTDDVRDELTACLQQIWDIVKPTLCNDAPEGYLPEDFEEIPDVSTKDTLSYCWRALKEASLLLGVLVSAATPSPADRNREVKRLRLLSDLCFTQLAELRHRGAFSTVAQTWTTCCTRSEGVLSLTGQSQLEAWYGQVLLILRNRTTINTRRSAGLPSLICGILAADGSGRLMHQAFADLEAIALEDVDAAATQEGSLPQVHAMNCQKDILKNSKLGEQSEKYVAGALQLAATALRSETWAIRNCGLMLFRAVTDRLFGTNEAAFENDNQNLKTLSIQNHPQLFDIVLSLLATAQPADASDGVVSGRYEGVFPALRLLQRLQVPAARLTEVRAYVFALTTSPVWHVRDKAAFSYVSLVSNEEVLQGLQGLLETDLSSQNALHGALSSAKYLIAKLAGNRNPTASTHISMAFRSSGSMSCMTLVELCWIMLIDAAGPLYDTNRCPITKKAYLEVCTECMEMLQHPLDTAPVHAEQTGSSLSGGAYYSRRLPFLDDVEFSTSSNDTNQALLRPTLARMYALHISFAQPKVEPARYTTILENLASVDPDACIEFLATMRTQWRSGHASLSDIATMIESIDRILRSDNGGVRIRCELLQTLLDILPDIDPGHPMLSETATAWSSAPMISKYSNQSYADLALELQAMCIEIRMHTKQLSSADPLHALQSWVAICEMAVAGSGTHSREAAALAIARLHTTWQRLAASSMLPRSYLRLCILVYDLLNDDDEDLRLPAAQMTGRILTAETSARKGTDLVPLVASQELVKFLTRKWPTNTDLAEVALKRAFGMTPTSFSPVANRFDQYGQSDTALFAEEKQNLYIDEAREVKVWCQVLLRLRPSVLSRRTVSSLATWVAGGLATLKTRSAREEDSAVKLTPNAGIFVVGMQVIYGAELLLHLAACGRKLHVPVAPSFLRRLLMEIATASSPGGSSCLWRNEIERILARSVLQKLRIVHERLHQFMRQSTASSAK